MRPSIWILAFLFCSSLVADDATRDSYNATATAYAEKTASLLPEKKMREFLSHIPEYGRILDAGCGPGRDARIFSELDYEVTGIDFSSALLDIARETAPRAHFLEKSLEDLSIFPSASFDGVWANASLHHIAKQQLSGVFIEMHRILQPKGILYVSVKMGIGESLEPDQRYGGVPKYWAYYSETEMVDLLKRNGFEILNIEINQIQGSYQTHPFIRVLAVKVCKEIILE